MRGAEALVRIQQDGGRLLAGAHAELLERRREVALDGALGEEQAKGDLAVAEAAHHEREHLLLTVREGGPDGAAVKLTGKRDLPGERRARGRGERGLELGLGDEGARARAERRAHAGAEQR